MNTNNVSSTTKLNLKNHWVEQYRKAGALWIHDENPKRPHALLMSGEHSNGFFNSRLIINNGPLMHTATMDLIRYSMLLNVGDIGSISGVVGPQTGATMMAMLLSENIKFIAKKSCFSASPAKHEENGVKSMVFNPEELSLLSETSLVLCEDVITTGGSLKRTATAAKNAGAIILPFVFALVNRSGMTEIDGRKVIALIDHPMQKWTAENCPLCATGSKALHPKDEGNWALLNSES